MYLVGLLTGNLSKHIRGDQAHGTRAQPQPCVEQGGELLAVPGCHHRGGTVVLVMPDRPAGKGDASSVFDVEHEVSRAARAAGRWEAGAVIDGRGSLDRGSAPVHSLLLTMPESRAGATCAVYHA
eukprot:1160592-Pelagomonas_calceolata.AAC.5